MKLSLPGARALATPLLPDGVSHSELTFEKYRSFHKCSGSRVRCVPTVAPAGGAPIGRDSELAMLDVLVTEAAAVGAA